MRMCIVLAPLLISCCASVSAEEIRPTRADFQISLEVRYLPRQQAFDYCKSLGLWPNVQVMPKHGRQGCNLYYPGKKHCVIVTPAPMHVDDDATLNLGHELDHCLRGKYHD